MPVLGDQGITPVGKPRKLKHIDDRVKALNPKLTQANPSVAAEIVLSPHVKNEDLPEVSTAAYEGFSLGYKPSAAGAEMVAESKVTPHTEGSLVEQFVQAGGSILAAPFKATGAVLAAASSVVPGGEVARKYTGIAARGLEKGIGYGTRVTEDLALHGLHSFGAPDVSAIEDAQGKHWDITDVPSYQQFEKGEHSSFTKLWFDVVGLDPKDYNGLAQVMDLSTDVLFQEAIVRGAIDIKAARTVATGPNAGERFISSRPGKNVVERVSEVVEKTPAQDIRNTLIAKFKHMTPSLAEELSKAATKDDVARTLAGYIDEVPSVELPKAYTRLDELRRSIYANNGPAPDPLLMSKKGDIGQVGLDSGEYVYRIDRPTDAGRIAGEGWDPAKSPTGKTYFSDDPFKTYDLSDRVTAQGTGGDFNIYRVPKDSTMMEQPGEWVSRNGLPPESIEVYTKNGWQPLRNGNLTVLRAEEAALTQRVADLQAREPVFDFPKYSRTRAFMRMEVPADAGRVSRILDAFLKPFKETGVFDLSKFTDDISPKDLKLQGKLNTAENMEIVRKEMNIAKVPKATQRAIFDQMMDVKTVQDKFFWRNELNKAFEQGMTRGGQRALTPEGMQAIRWSELEDPRRAPIEIKATLEDGTTTTVTRNVLEKADGTPLPTQPNEFLGDITLPDVQLLRQGSSTIRHWDFEAKNTPVIGKIYGVARVPYDIAKFTALTVPRLILKPIALLSARLLIKIQLDQALRNIATGLKPLDKWGKNYDFDVAGVPVQPGIRDLLPNQDMGALGMVAEEMGWGKETIVQRVQTRLLDPYTTPAEAQRVVYGVHDQLLHLAQDELARKVAAFGPEDTLQYLTDHPNTRLGDWYRSDMKPLLDENGITPEAWLKSKRLQIEQAAGGDPALVDAVATGKWKVARPVKSGAAMELELRQAELEEARSALLDTPGGIAHREMGLRVEELERRVERLQKSQLATDQIDIADADAVANELSTRWTEGTYKPPAEVSVQRAVKFDDKPGSFFERVKAKADAANRAIYRRFKPMASADLHLTRGSTFGQVLKLTYDDLIRRGYGKEEAFEIAQHRAAYVAKDLHYDIGARSSFDKSVKDLFWFSAVYREQLTTWLWKIPSKAYWPIGAPLRAAEALEIFHGLKALGILEDHEYYNPETKQTEKELVANVPWVTNFIAKVLDNSEAGKLRVGGLNPITPGTSGVVPSLSPGAEAVLSMAAKVPDKDTKYLVQFLSRTLTFDQDTDQGPSFVPASIRAGLEYLGINLPWDTLKISDYKEAKNKARVQSIRWAASDLAKDGTLPPGPDASDAEVEAYRTKLLERSHDYRQGLAIIHLASAVLVPGSFTTESGVTNAGQAFYKWRENNPLYKAAQEDWEKNSPAWYAAQNEYLKAHPAAWAYSFGSKVSLPEDTEFTPEAYAAQPTLEPDDYVTKALQVGSYWQDDALKDPSTGEVKEPTTPAEVDALSPRQRIRKTAAYADTTLTDLNPTELHALGIPDFEGRHHLLETIATINNQYEKLSDSDKEFYADRLTNLLEKAAAKYGHDGAVVLRMSRWDTTPAEKLQFAGHLQGRTANQAVAAAQAIWRDTLAQGYNPLYDSEYVVQRKVEFFQQVDRARRADPKFDQEIRRLILGITDLRGPLMKVDAYNQLFFGMGYGDTAIARELKRG